MWNVCRCCSITTECSRDIFSKYLNAERAEVYEVMLKETFNIEMSRKQSDDRSNTLICESCVSRLQEASAFKETVLRSELMFAKFLNSQINSDNLEIIKNEDFDVKSDDGRYSPENETSYVMKEEMKDIQSNYEEASVIKRNIYTSDRDANARKKVKKKSNAGDIKSRNDITKITEQRGNGPILRENTLKLIENSTIFAFQWHKSKYTCFCCQKPFLNMDDLKNHTSQHTLKDIEKKIITQQNMPVKVDITVLNCSLCRTPLTDLQDLRDHLIETHNFEFKMKEDLLIPFKIGDELKCQLCTEQFTMFRLLNIHMNRHYKKQVCHICGAAFSNLRFLNLHIYRTHRCWKCKECNIQFASKSEKRTHDFKVHEKKYPTKLRFPCPHCDERYDQEGSRVLHLVEKHGLSRPAHKCSVCPKSFITKSLCNNHFKAVHKKERKHLCDICNNLFYTKSDVARHRVTHTGEKKFSCSVCNVLFATKDSLRRHMKRTHAV